MITPRKRLLPLLTPLVGLAMATTVLGAPGASAATTVPLTDCASSDNGKPVVSSFRLGTPTANVRGGEDRIPVTAVVDDTGGPGPATGVERVLVVLSVPGNPDTQHSRVPQLLAPTADGRTWRGTLTLPRGVVSGVWSAELIVADKAYAEVVLGPEDLRAIGSDPDIAVRSSGVDTTAPALRTLTVSRARVDTRNASRRVTVTVRATDAGAGLGKVVVRARAKNGLRGAKAALRLVAGTRTFGTWRGSVVLPRWAGTRSSWRLSAHLADRLSNTRTISAGELARNGDVSAITVRSLSDLTAPRVSDIRISTRVLDVREADRVLRVSAKVTDAGSGLGAVFAYAMTAAEDGAFSSVRMHRISGTRHAGRWAGEIEVSHCQSGYRPPSGDREFGVTIDVADRAHRYGESDQSPRVATRFRDNAWPWGDAVLRPSGLVDVIFQEDVVANGNWNPRLTARGNTAEVPGTWTCNNASGFTVSCDADPFRSAHFTPATPLAQDPTYDVTVNREHTLHVVDLAGNPVLGVRPVYVPEGAR